MKALLLKTVPFLLFCTYFLTRYLRSNFSEVIPDFFRFYYTDLIFIPIALGFAYLFILRIKRPEIPKVPWVLILVQVVFNVVIFEYYLPNFASNKHEYTADFWDVVMYAIGGILFFLWAYALRGSLLKIRSSQAGLMNNK